MDPRDQARLVRLQYGGHGQSFASSDLSGYGAGTSTAPTPGRVEWHNQRNATNNGVVASPANIARQQGAIAGSTSGSPGWDPKSPATHELKYITENRRILESALSSSLQEHTRREGRTANTCAVCNDSFQTNTKLESHAKETRHSSFVCACDMTFGRLSSLSRHINSNTGSGYHCELCDDRTLPRIDKLYDHLRGGHKVSQKVLDRYRNKASARPRRTSRATNPAPAPAPAPPQAPLDISQAASLGGYVAWTSAGQVNGMYGRHTMSMTPSSPNSINPTILTIFNDHFTLP